MLLNKVVTDGGSRMPQQDYTFVIKTYYTKNTGNVQVKIIDNDGFSSNFSVSGSGSTSIDTSLILNWFFHKIWIFKRYIYFNHNAQIIKLNMPVFNLPEYPFYCIWLSKVIPLHLFVK